MTGSTRRSQTGATALGLLILACLVGVVGLAVIKVTPMYLKNMRMTRVLENVADELSGQNATPQTIRNELQRRFIVEDIRMSSDQLKIAPSKNGYSLNVKYEERAPYVADIDLVIVYDKQVEITR